MTLVRNRVDECYSPGSGKPLDLWRCVSLVVHHCSLSRGAPGNPHPIPDELLDGPALAGRFRDRGLGTGGATPYHVLVTLAGVVEQLLPLTVRGAHAAGHNRDTLAVCVAGESVGMPDAQAEALAQVCARMVPVNALEIRGHCDTPGWSPDPYKRCPRPTVDVVALRSRVRSLLPSGYLTWPRVMLEQGLVDAGFVL